MTEVQPQWSEHAHDSVTHDHKHYHVTHNYFERAGAFEHLGYEHSHSHEHASEAHAHYPHRDFEAEHAGEAHEHPHPASSAKKPAAAAKKAGPAPKKAAPAAAAATVTGAAKRAAPAAKSSGAGKSPAAAKKQSTPVRRAAGAAGPAGDGGRRCRGCRSGRRRDGRSTTLSRPVIALVAYALPASETPRRPVGHVAVSDRYVDSLHRAGARVVMLPATATAPSVAPAEMLGDVDGLLLVGGGDLDPALYGQVAHEKSYGFNPARDDTELALARYAIDEDLPMLAICRGCQVINVACGGTLHQHVPDLPGFHVDAHGRPHDVVFAEHAVTAEAGSRLEEALGGERRITRCTSAHHQAVDALGAGLRVSGRSDDGCVEALEPLGPHRFLLAVQWHPEMTAESDPQQQALFDALVAAAGSGGPGTNGERRAQRAGDGRPVRLSSLGGTVLGGEEPREEGCGSTGPPEGAPVAPPFAGGAEADLVFPSGLAGLWAVPVGRLVPAAGSVCSAAAALASSKACEARRHPAPRKVSAGADKPSSRLSASPRQRSATIPIAKTVARERAAPSPAVAIVRSRS